MGVGGEWGRGLLLLLGQAEIDVVLVVVGEDGGRRGRVGRKNMEVTRQLVGELEVRGGGGEVLLLQLLLLLVVLVVEDRRRGR